MDLTKFNFNNPNIKNTLFKLYDQGKLYLMENDDEKAFMMLRRFMDCIMELRRSKLCKEDKNFIENSITNKKVFETMDILERLRLNLLDRYSIIQNKALNEIKDKVEKNVDINEKKTNPVNPLEEKIFLSPIEMIEFINNTDNKILLIDIRSQTEYNFSHINFNILLNDAKKKNQSLINIPGDLIQGVSWKIADNLVTFDKENQSNSSHKPVAELFKKRKEFDYLILMDKESTCTTFKTTSQLSILKRALYEFDTDEKLKHEPKILDGGWTQWLGLYPACFSSSSKDPTLSGLINSNGNSEKNSLSTLKNSLKFDYPELNKLEITTSNVVNDVNNRDSNKNLTNKTIPENTSRTSIENSNQNTENKNLLNQSSNNKMTSNAQLNLPKISNGSIPQNNTNNMSTLVKPVPSVANIPSVPTINRLNKPNLPVKETNEVIDRQMPMFYSSDESDTDEITRPNSETNLIVETQPKPISIKANIPSNPVPILYSSDESYIDELKRPNTETNLIGETQSSQINSTNKNPLTNISINTTEAPKSHILNPVIPESSNIFDMVYKPATRFKPVQTPLMKDGERKILDPATGLFKIDSNQPEPPVNKVILILFV